MTDRIDDFLTAMRTRRATGSIGRLELDWLAAMFPYGTDGLSGQSKLMIARQAAARSEQSLREDLEALRHAA